MKKYVVFRIYKASSPDIAFMSDDLNRAKMWAEATSGEENREYVVASVEAIERFKPEEE